MGDLKEIQAEQRFIAFKVEGGSTTVKSYKRIDGIFLKKDYEFLFYNQDINNEEKTKENDEKTKKNDGEKKKIAIDSLIVFKKQQK
jgi:hypothetical protein